MKELPPTIRHLFPPTTALSGIGAVMPSEGGARAVAQGVIKCVGGLKVGAVGPGMVFVSGDIEFHRVLRLDREVVVRPWNRQLGALMSVADAHHSHIMLFVDCNASFYAFTDPDGKLYALGCFPQAMETLLVGLDFGMPLEVDS